MHVAHQPGRTRNVADHSGVAEGATQGLSACLRGRCAGRGSTRKKCEDCLRPESLGSGARRRPRGRVTGLVDPDLQVGRTAPDAPGDHPAREPGVGQARGLGGEDGRGGGRDVRHGGREPLVVDGDDGGLGREPPAWTALAPGTAVLARLGVSGFVQVADRIAEPSAGRPRNDALSQQTLLQMGIEWLASKAMPCQDARPPVGSSITPQACGLIDLSALLLLALAGTIEERAT